MLFDEELLAKAGLSLRNQSNEEVSIEEIHMNPISLLDDFKGQEATFVNSPREILKVSRDGENFSLFGTRGEGVFATSQSGSVYYLDHEKKEFCNSSLKNFVIMHLSLMECVASLKIRKIIDDSSIMDLFEKCSSDVEERYNSLEDKNSNFWQEIIYELDEGFFPLKPMLHFYLRNNIVNLPGI